MRRLAVVAFWLTRLQALRAIGLTLVLVVCVVTQLGVALADAAADDTAAHDMTGHDMAGHDMAGHDTSAGGSSADDPAADDTAKQADAGAAAASGADSLPVPTPPQLPSDVPAPEGRESLVLRVQLDEGITNGTLGYMQDAIAAAEAQRAEALVVVLDTPGGLLEATRGIVQEMFAAPLPVVVYVAPAGARAGSAGVFLTLAAHVAVMHPTSNIGAAHPVSGFGGDIEGEMARKVENDTAAWARSLAQSRGRNSEWAKKAVLESAALTAGEAKQAKVVDLLSASMDQLLSDADGRIVLVRDQPWRVTTAGAAVVDFDRNPQQRMHALLANPTLVYLLLLLGILGVYVEMQNPGMIVPGVLGAACLFVVFGVQTLPLNSLGLLLIGLSAVLFFAEVYVTSFGVLSVAAIAALVAGSSMLFDVTGSSFRLPTSALWGTALSFSALVLWIGNKLLRAKRQGATSGTEVMVGSEARALSPIAPGKRGKVFFDGSYWDAQSEEDVAEGQRCRVERVDGLLLHVSPLLETDGS